MPSKAKVALPYSRAPQMAEPGSKLGTTALEFLRRFEGGSSSRFSPQRATRVRVWGFPLCTPLRNDMTAGSRSSRSPATAPGSRCGFRLVIDDSPREGNNLLEEPMNAMSTVRWLLCDVQ